MKPISSVFLIFLVFCQSCSPQRKLSRLLEHHPELTVADTLKFRDTVAIPAAMTDTMIDLKMMTDTVIIEKERLSVAALITLTILLFFLKPKPDT